RLACQTQDLNVLIVGVLCRRADIGGVEWISLHDDESQSSVDALVISAQLYSLAIALNRHRNMLGRMTSHVLRHLRGTSYVLAIDGNKAIVLFQAYGFGRRALIHLYDNNRQATVIRYEIQSTCGFAILHVGSRRDCKRDFLANSIHYDRQRTTRREQRVAIDNVPARVLCAIERDDAISGLEAGLSCGAIFLNVINNRRWCCRNAIHERTDKWDRHCGEDVHDWASECNHDPLPSGTQVVHLLRRNVLRAFTFERRV